MARLIESASVENLNVGDVVRFKVRSGRGLFGNQTGICRIEKFVQVPRRDKGPGRQIFRPGDWLVHIVSLRVDYPYKSESEGPETRFQPGDLFFAPKDSTSDADWRLYHQPGSAFLDTLLREVKSK